VRETVEFRIPEKHAARHLPDDAGIRIGNTVRMLTLSTDDPMFAEIGRLDQERQSQGRAFFTSWISRRRYSRRELLDADCLHLTIRKVFEPAG